MNLPSKHSWYGGGKKHVPAYCGKKFRVNGKTFTYEEADSINSNGDLVIKFSDAQKIYVMPEAEFFSKVFL